MKKQNKIYLTLGIIVLVLIASIIIFSNSQKEETIKIGVSLPLTGNLAIIGDPMRAAIDLAIEDVNANSNKYKFEAIYEDDQFAPSKALSAVQKLLSVDKVDFLITAGSPVGMAVGPIAEESKLIHFGIASADVAGIGPYNFNHWTPPKKQVEKMVNALEELNIKKVALISFNQEGGMAIRNALIDEVKNSDIVILTEEKFSAGEKDFKTLWQKVENSNPEIIILLAMSPELEIFLKQRIELGYTTPLTAIESPKYSENPELFNGNWFIDGADTSSEFVKKFEEETGKKIFTFSGNAYDIVMMVAKTLERFDEKPSSEKLRDSLLELGYYEGAMGPMTMDSEGNLLTEAIKMEMVNGVPVKI
jgi:branched-chain amino acid transport system substrate-binding protein